MDFLYVIIDSWKNANPYKKVSILVVVLNGVLVSGIEKKKNFFDLVHNPLFDVLRKTWPEQITDFKYHGSQFFLSFIFSQLSL